MIRINLLTRTQSSRGVFPRSLRRPLIIGFAGLTAVALVLTFILILTQVSGPTPEEPAASDAATVEQGPVRVAYTSLPIRKRLAYEMIFAQEAVELLQQAVPDAAMPPVELHIDSFRTVRVLGTAQSKQPVVKALAGFRRDGVKLLPRPQTRVSVSGDKYLYTITTHMVLPLDTRGGALDSLDARLPEVDAYTDEVRRFERLAADAHISIDGGLRLASALKAGVYRRYVYRMDARGTYTNVVKLIQQLRANRVSCAFGFLHLTDGGASTAAISAEVYFTARE